MIEPCFYQTPAYANVLAESTSSFHALITWDSIIALHIDLLASRLVDLNRQTYRNLSKSAVNTNSDHSVQSHLLLPLLGVWFSGVQWNLIARRE